MVGETGAKLVSDFIPFTGTAITLAELVHGVIEKRSIEFENEQQEAASKLLSTLTFKPVPHAAVTGSPPKPTGQTVWYVVALLPHAPDHLSEIPSREDDTAKAQAYLTRVKEVWPQEPKAIYDGAKDALKIDWNKNYDNGKGGWALVYEAYPYQEKDDHKSKFGKSDAELKSEQLALWVNLALNRKTSLSPPMIQKGLGRGEVITNAAASEQTRFHIPAEAGPWLALPDQDPKQNAVCAGKYTISDDSRYVLTCGWLDGELVTCASLKTNENMKLLKEEQKFEYKSQWEPLLKQFNTSPSIRKDLQFAYDLNRISFGSYKYHDITGVTYTAERLPGENVGRTCTISANPPMEDRGKYNVRNGFLVVIKPTGHTYLMENNPRIISNLEAYRYEEKKDLAVPFAGGEILHEPEIKDFARFENPLVELLKTVRKGSDYLIGREREQKAAETLAKADVGDPIQSKQFAGQVSRVLGDDLIAEAQAEAAGGQKQADWREQQATQDGLLAEQYTNRMISDEVFRRRQTEKLAGMTNVPKALMREWETERDSDDPQKRDALWKKIESYGPSKQYWVQVVSASNQLEALHQWETMKTSNSDLLNGMRSSVSTSATDKSAYVVRVGPIVNNDDAIKFCTKLQGRGIECRVLLYSVGS